MPFVRSLRHSFTLFSSLVTIHTCHFDIDLLHQVDPANYFPLYFRGLFWLLESLFQLVHIIAMTTMVTTSVFIQIIRFRLVLAPLPMPRL